MANYKFKTNISQYSDNELQLMSYQDLRRLSILLQLPANIKKKYMISMIKAHQKGDSCMKSAIANRIIEERKVKRFKQKQSKSFMLDSSENTQQIPTDLSVSAQHEFETRFSYVAHYSKDDLSSGMSKIIKQEAEVSRRNKSILQQPRKPTRKISTVGRTEIILPRNHSLTTPVRLMPQHERGFPSIGYYETVTGFSNAKTHFQDLNYNYQFHEEFSNTLTPTASHELYKNEPYWPTKEAYSNSLMPVFSSLLSPSSVAVNSSSYASQYTCSNSMNGPSSFQGVYENYVKNNNNIIESQAFQSSAANSSTLVVNNHRVINNSSCNSYSVNRRPYLLSKEEAEFETPLDIDETNCQHDNKRETTVIKNLYENESFSDFYSSGNSELDLTYHASHIAATRDVDQCSNVCFATESNDVPVPAGLRPLEPLAMEYKTTKTINDQDDSEMNQENVPQLSDDYESNYAEEGRLWEESESGLKKLIGRSHIEKENFKIGFLSTERQTSFLSDICHVSTNLSTETHSNHKQLKSNGKETTAFVPSQVSKCRFTSGHYKYPESVTDTNKVADLPSFLSTFCSNESCNRAYSVSRNSFTAETTETHLHPIMASIYAPQFSPQTQRAQNSKSGTQIHRHRCYTYPESLTPFHADPTIRNEYFSGMESSIISPESNPSVQIVKCHIHGCHYFYSVSNPCE